MWKENFHRGLGRYGLGSVRVPPLILPQKTGVLPDGRPSEGMWPRFLIVPWEESLASLAGGGDAPSNPLAVRPRAFTVRGGECHGLGGKQRGVAPLFFFIHKIYHDMIVAT